MSAPLRFGTGLLPLLAVLSLSGCMSMSGLGGDSKYACKAPDGVTCDSVSGTYANAVANNLPGQRKRPAASNPAQAERQAPRPAAPPRAPLSPAGGSSAQEPGRRCAHRPATCVCGSSPGKTSMATSTTRPTSTSRSTRAAG